MPWKKSADAILMMFLGGEAKVYRACRGLQCWTGGYLKLLLVVGNWHCLGKNPALN